MGGGEPCSIGGPTYSTTDAGVETWLSLPGLALGAGGIQVKEAGLFPREGQLHLERLWALPAVGTGQAGGVDSRRSRCPLWADVRDPAVGTSHLPVRLHPNFPLLQGHRRLGSGLSLVSTFPGASAENFQIRSHPKLPGVRAAPSFGDTTTPKPRDPWPRPHPGVQGHVGLGRGEEGGPSCRSPCSAVPGDPRRGGPVLVPCGPALPPPTPGSVQNIYTKRLF